MTVSYDQMMSIPPIVTRQAYGARDTILYALGVGAGIGAAEGDDASELSYVYEEQLSVLPTMAAVLATPGFWLKNPLFGADWTKILHGEQRLNLHKSLPCEGRVRSELTVDEIYDKGPGKGAVLHSSRRVYNEDNGDLLATVSQASFMRGDGGCGGKTSGAPKPVEMPDAVPDLVIDLATRSEQALIYRLSGDYNSLHADPAVARNAGFERPILHGLCTFGVAGRALMKAARICGRGPLTGIEVRFSSPVYPGETIQTELWWHGNKAFFRARIASRDLTVLNNGIASFQ
jgi:acyl dehydratase